MAEPVVIVGASAAGLHLARSLAAAGVRVRVYERAVDPPKQRTLIVTSAYTDILGDLGKRAIVNEIREFDLRAGKVIARVPLLRPDLIIERATLLEDLRLDAKEAGAELLPGRRFIGLEHHADGANVSFAVRGSDEVEIARTRILVAADGATSDVAAALSLPRPPLVPLLQAIVPLPDDLPTDTSRVWFAPRDTPFFTWIIPDGPSQAALGIIGVDGPRARALLDAQCARLGLVVRAYQAARIPAYRRWIPLRRRLGALDTFVVGDAAGHVKVSTVGGIVTGFRGAQAVGRAILDGDGRAAARSLRVELDAHQVVHRALAGFTERDYEALLCALDGQVLRGLAGTTRDEPVRALARACWARPKLIGLGARGLLRRS